MALTLTACLAGCGSDPNDPADQAEDLADPVRRAGAIQNIDRIFATTLADHEGNRQDPAVKAVIDATVDKLAACFTSNREDTAVGAAVLNILREMHDPRALPALTAALDFQRESTEQLALTAAQAIKDVPVPAGQKAQVAQALMRGFQKIPGDRPLTPTRPADELLMKAYVEALGSLHDSSATQPLIQIATSTNEKQNFLINRLALMQLGATGDVAAIPALVKGLFLRSKDLRFGMEDVAMAALVRVGRPALQPLLNVLRNQDADARAAAESQIANLRTVNAQAAQGMTAEGLMIERATTALGGLGLPEALDPLLAIARGTDATRKINACLALMQLHLNAQQQGQVRDVVVAAVGGTGTSPDGLRMRASLFGGMLNTFDPGYLPTLLAQARDTNLHIEVRITASSTYAFLANKTEAAQLAQMIAAEPTGADGGFREQFARAQPAIDAANACDVDLACWRGKLSASDPIVVRKAAYMVGRLGSGNAEAVAGLIPLISHRLPEVRIAALYALDHIATSGSPDAVAKIDELRQREEGQSVWRAVSQHADLVQNRLRAVGGS